MNRIPDVAVLMTAYNAQDYIQDAIESFLGQTYPEAHRHLFVVDDGSTDDTLAIASRYDNADIESISAIAQSHSGRGKALELAAWQVEDCCMFDYVILLDADDTWQPECLEVLVAMAEFSGADVTYGDHRNMEESGMPYGAIAPRCSVKFDRDRMLQSFCTFHPQLMRYSAFLEAGGFDSGMEYATDYDLHLRLSRKHFYKHVPAVLANYRIHSKQISQEHRPEQRRYSQMAVERELQARAE